jgi:hypothetical protein
MSADKVSTSALAKLAELPVQQLFSVLKDYGWIRKVEDGWVLTAKGEFEGGSYISSKRYGRYIVWPVSVLEHPLLQAVESNKLLSANALGSAEGFSGRQINRMLVELGWLKPSVRGWELMPAGIEQGAQVFESQQTSLSYVLWPEDVREHAALLRLMSQCRSETEAGDLFAENSDKWLSLDGKCCKSKAHWQISQWLYLAGLRFAMYRPLPVAETLVSDFYLPESGLYIEYWDSDDYADVISERMRRADLCKKMAWPVLDIHPEDLPQLDDYLCRHLANQRVEFY